MNQTGLSDEAWLSGKKHFFSRKVALPPPPPPPSLGVGVGVGVLAVVVGGPPGGDPPTTTASTPTPKKAGPSLGASLALGWLQHNKGGGCKLLNC